MKLSRKHGGSVKLMQPSLTMEKINRDSLTTLFEKLKSVYKASEISSERKEFILSRVKKYGYLPYPHIKALEELTPAETIIGIEEKLKINKIYNGEKFIYGEN